MNAQAYSSQELAEWYPWFDKLGQTGPYHAPDYVAMLAGEFEYESESAELFVYGDQEAFVYYPYIRRSLSDLSFADKVSTDLSQYSDIVSSWYYGGPLLSPEADRSLADEFAEEFTEYCHQERIVSEFLRFDPNIENHSEFDVLNPKHNRQTVPVDLTQSKDTIFEGYEGRNRRAIKQARESPIEIDREYTDQDIEAFHSIYTNAMEARDAAPHYRFNFSFFRELVGSELCSPLIARHEEEVIGGFLIAHDADYAHHYLSASNPDYWDDRVNNLMYHEAVMYMHGTGRKVFDFQGGRPGVFKFKKGFSPDRRDFYIGSRIHMPEMYDTLVDVAADTGIETEDQYFPAYRPNWSN